VKALSLKNKMWLWITVVFLAGLVVGGAKLHHVSALTTEKYKKLKIFTDVLSIVQKNYIKEVDIDDLIYGAIKGMLGTLDPHSSFMPPDMYKELQVETTGSFGGLGIEITIREGVLTVVSPIEDTPAFRMGIQAGDQIIKIEGEPTKKMNIMDAVKKMRGPKDTKVTITIWRSGWIEPKDFTIVRDIIHIRSIKSKVIEKGYGYIRIKSFQEDSGKNMRSALKRLVSEEGGLKGLILDLRNNPGGLLDQAVQVSDAFLESGTIVYTDGRLKGQNMHFKATKDGTFLGFPMVVLINSGSASASEIVAGALQDHQRAIILGTQSFGKASVQTIVPMEDGSGLRLTTALYYTPSDHSIQAKGITPDIVVEPGEKVSAKDGKRRFLREKDLERHLEKEGKEKEKKKDEDIVEEKLEDLQLNRALDLLKSWYVFKKVASRD
jgi:carboxyl-terminal processing protease